ncbi:Myb-like_DNA-binding domain-containing protein [Hexamita inflata]|uniref:Myb-like DNA-binding domain-containing protein n=1 Tax=Hexamita inflata TaxID=28002 RepID=A0AA86PVC7_9EUKA|nr:Myb-like DNA-binding domain-containing protein [Hexamita inflata]
MKRITWTTMEIEQLTNITEHSRKFDKKIDWDLVASQIPSRTASQCKSYYANVLKKTLDVPIRQNHQWNRVEIMSLWALGVNYDKDFAFIQKNYCGVRANFDFNKCLCNNCA